MVVVQEHGSPCRRFVMALFFAIRADAALIIAGLLVKLRA
jgi:hypothetical protein